MEPVFSVLVCMTRATHQPRYCVVGRFSINDEKYHEEDNPVRLLAGLLAGCASPAQRMAECQAQGINKDACYQAEQNRQASIMNAAEKQALGRTPARRSNNLTRLITCTSQALDSPMQGLFARVAQCCDVFAACEDSM